MVSGTEKEKEKRRRGREQCYGIQAKGVKCARRSEGVVCLFANRSLAWNCWCYGRRASHQVLVKD